MTQNDVIVENFNSIALMLEGMKSVPEELMDNLIVLMRESAEHVLRLDNQIARSYQEGMLHGYETGHRDGWDEAVKYLNTEYKNMLQNSKVLTVDISENMEKVASIYYNEQFAATLKSRTDISETAEG